MLLIPARQVAQLCSIVRMETHTHTQKTKQNKKEKILNIVIEPESIRIYVLVSNSKLDGCLTCTTTGMDPRSGPRKSWVQASFLRAVPCMPISERLLHSHSTCHPLPGFRWQQSRSVASTLLPVTLSVSATKWRCWSRHQPTAPLRQNYGHLILNGDPNI